MEIENSALYRDILSVINSGAKQVHHTWKATVHIGNRDVEVLKVVERDTLMEFDNKYAAETMLAVEVGLGTYAYQFYPNRERLEITLTRYPIGEVGDAPNTEVATETVRYTAVLVELGDVTLEGNTANTASEESLNLVRLVTVEFQLVDKVMEQLRAISIGMTPRNAKIEDVVKAILTNVSQQVDVDESMRPQGVSMVKASNQTKYDHVVIDHHGIRLVQLPAYLQQKYGIYSAGLGYFYHQRRWHLYPRYNVEREMDSGTSLTIINVPKNRFPGSERTYQKVGSHVTILATGDVKMEDLSTIAQLNAGNGVRFVDANNFMEEFFVTKNNKTVASRARNVSEFTGVERDNGMNNVRSSDNYITANAFVEYSKLAERNGAYFSMRWEHSDQSLIVPGMVAKILYLDNGEIKEIRGSLLKAHHFDQMAGEGYTRTRYYSHSVLVFFVERSLPAK